MVNVHAYGHAARQHIVGREVEGYGAGAGGGLGVGRLDAADERAGEHVGEFGIDGEVVAYAGLSSFDFKHIVESHKLITHSGREARL